MTASGNRFGDSNSTARDRAHNAAGQVVDKVQETTSRITGASQDSSGTPIMEQATEQVTSRLDMGKEYVAESVTGVAQALRQTGQHLREEAAQPMLATYADRGAEQIERFGGYLRQREPGQLMEDVERFARRQPMVFAGGAFALGMLAVRFLRSESPTRSQTPPSATSPSPAASGPMPQYVGPGSVPGASSPPPGGYTAAAQSALNRAPASETTVPPSGGAGARPSESPGTPAAPGPGAGASVTPSERPTPKPAAAPSVGGTSSVPGTTRTGGGSSTSERTGTGSRNQS